MDDVISVIQHYGTPRFDPVPGYIWDIDGSGRVMVIDILLVVQRLGEVC